MPSSKRRTWIFVLLLVAAIAWLVYKSRSSGFDTDQFLAAFKRIDPFYFSLAVLLMVATYPGRAIRWAVMLRPIKPELRLWPLISATVIGFGAMSILGRAGEIVRPYLIARSEKVPMSTQMAAWFVERILDMIVVVSLFGFALFQLHHTSASVTPEFRSALETGGILICLATAAGVAVTLTARQSSEFFRRRILEATTFLKPATQDKINQLVDSFVQGMMVTKHPGVWAKLLFYTAIEWLLILGSYHFLARSFGALQHLDWLDNTLIMSIVALGSLISIPGVGGGMQASAVVALTDLFRIPVEPATSYALLLWVLNLLLVLPFSFACAISEGLSFRQIRQLEETVPQ